MIEELNKLRDEILATLQGVNDLETLEEARVKYLSRNGALPKLLEGLKDVPKDLKPQVGKLANEVKMAVAMAFDEKKEGLSRVQVDYTDFDVTLPGRRIHWGSTHPITKTVRDISRIFEKIGFSLAEGPDIETEFYNFDALNTPADHPARNEQDTFYIAGQIADDKLGRHLLRTQTSPVQIRVMEKIQPPVRIIAPGSCFRRDNPDATHALMFHQIEGLCVDENVSLADLKGTMEYFFRELLGENTKVRFRPHFFPFTEPSFEIDFSIPGKKIRGKEWLEIAGCGMVHPHVFESAGYDPEKYTGFAFGMGVERIAMMLYGIDDIRWFTENNVRFLSEV